MVKSVILWFKIAVMKFSIANAVRIISCLLALMGLLYIRSGVAAVVQNQDERPPTFSAGVFFLAVAFILFSISFTKTFNESIGRGPLFAAGLWMAVALLGICTLLGIGIVLAGFI